MSVEGRRARDGDGSVGRVLENKLSDLDLDFPNAKFSQEMRGKIVGEGFNKSGSLFRDERFCALAESRVIDSARDCVLHIAVVAGRPNRNIQDKPLAFLAFSRRNADMREHFELLNMDLSLGGNFHRVLAHAKANITNDLSAEALLQLSQDVDLRHLLELVMQRGLEHSHIENSFPQSDRR